MRPTDIKLKTPGDQTPGPKYFFNLTSTGKSLSYSKIFKDKKTFCTEKRFKNYEDLAKRTCQSVGPGSYIRDQLSFIKKSLSKSTIKYHPTQKRYDSSKNNFYMVGNLLVCDESRIIQKKKYKKKNIKSHSSKRIIANCLNFSPKKY